MTRRLLAICLLLVFCGGCNLVYPIVYMFRPRQMQKPQHEFPTVCRVVFFIEAARSSDDHPVFVHALHERVVSLLREGKSGARLLPQSSVEDLRRKHDDFSQWSLQRVGRELEAEYVLYLRMDRLQILESSEYSVISPMLQGRLKVVGVDEPAGKERVWPDSREGWPVQVTRQTSESDDPDAADAEARKLGYDSAYWITMPFIEIDLETNTPVER